MLKIKDEEIILRADRKKGQIKSKTQRIGEGISQPIDCVVIAREKEGEELDRGGQTGTGGLLQ